MVSALLTLRSGRLWSWPPPIPLLEGRSEVSHGLCLFPFEDKVSVVMVPPYHFQKEDRKATVISHSPLGRWRSLCGHGQTHVPSREKGGRRL